MILDFWNTKLNPVTMQSRETESIYNSEKYRQKNKAHNYTGKDLSLNPDYVTAKETIKSLGIGAKTISSIMRSNGVERVSFKSNNVTYYKLSDVNKVSVPSKINTEPSGGYISSKDLQIELGLTVGQLFRVAQKKGWKKVRFSKNIVYYLKDQVLK